MHWSRWCAACRFPCAVLQQKTRFAMLNSAMHRAKRGSYIIEHVLGAAQYGDRRRSKSTQTKYLWSGFQVMPSSFFFCINDTPWNIWIINSSDFSEKPGTYIPLNLIPTGERISAPCGFSQIAGNQRCAAPRNLTWLFFYPFYTVYASGDLIPGKIRSPGLFERPDLTSPFATLRPRQSQSRWPSALKLAGCNKPIGIYNLFISDLLVDDLRSGKFLDLPIISKLGKIRWLIFHTHSL